MREAVGVADHELVEGQFRVASGPLRRSRCARPGEPGPGGGPRWRRARGWSRGRVLPARPELVAPAFARYEDDARPGGRAEAVGEPLREALRRAPRARGGQPSRASCAQRQEPDAVGGLVDDERRAGPAPATRCARARRSWQPQDTPLQGGSRFLIRRGTARVRSATIANARRAWRGWPQLARKIGRGERAAARLYWTKRDCKLGGSSRGAAAGVGDREREPGLVERTVTVDPPRSVQVPLRPPRPRLPPSRSGPPVRHEPNTPPTSLPRRPPPTPPPDLTTTYFPPYTPTPLPPPPLPHPTSIVPNPKPTHLPQPPPNPPTPPMKRTCRPKKRKRARTHGFRSAHENACRAADAQAPPQQGAQAPRGLRRAGADLVAD